MSSSVMSARHESFLAYKRGRYGYAALALMLVAALAYLLHQPLESPNGGTWLGYTLGTIAALLIVWLTLLGVRKRSYTSTLGTVKGWLSGHVYLGASMIVIATLHCGFQFGWNIHTMTYMLMVVVVLSGFVGLYGYLRYPNVMAANRSGQTRDQLFMEIVELDRQAVDWADKVDSETRGLVESAAERTAIGGGWWTQVSGRDHSKVILSSGGLTANADQARVVDWVNQRLATSRGGKETTYLQELLGVLARKRALLAKTRRDIRLLALLQLWLYVHVPLSFALLGALLAHILAVFTYW